MVLRILRIKANFVEFSDRKSFSVLRVVLSRCLQQSLDLFSTKATQVLRNTYISVADAHQQPGTL